MAKPLVSVVDDDESVRESLAGLIRSVGLAVKVFPSAEEFLGSVDVAGTNCLILDVRMPGMDGLQLQGHLKASYPELPVIFITAHGSEEEARRRALAAGALDYLLKPLSEEEVLSAVDRALRSPEGSDTGDIATPAGESGE
jgi:FixJ family two-component response regulator